jgi:hypothetical protein
MVADDKGTNATTSINGLMGLNIGFRICFF